MNFFYERRKSNSEYTQAGTEARPGFLLSRRTNGKEDAILVLTRKVHETCVITTPEGKRIEVVVTTLSNLNVRLGFIADVDVLIYRKEIQDQVDADKEREQ